MFASNFTYLNWSASLLVWTVATICDSCEDSCCYLFRSCLKYPCKYVPVPKVHSFRHPSVWIDYRENIEGCIFRKTCDLLWVGCCAPCPTFFFPLRYENALWFMSWGNIFTVRDSNFKLFFIVSRSTPTRCSPLCIWPRRSDVYFKVY